MPFSVLFYLHLLEPNQLVCPNLQPLGRLAISGCVEAFSTVTLSGHGFVGRGPSTYITYAAFAFDVGSLNFSRFALSFLSHCLSFRFLSNMQ